MGCRCSERLRAKAGGGERLTRTRWSEGRGYLRTGRFVSGRGECVRMIL
jgi:hypothetical protein